MLRTSLNPTPAAQPAIADSTPSIRGIHLKKKAGTSPNKPSSRNLTPNSPPASNPNPTNKSPFLSSPPLGERMKGEVASEKLSTQMTLNSQLLWSPALTRAAAPPPFPIHQ